MSIILSISLWQNSSVQNFKYQSIYWTKGSIDALSLAFSSLSLGSFWAKVRRVFSASALALAWAAADPIEEHEVRGDFVYMLSEETLPY